MRQAATLFTLFLLLAAGRPARGATEWVLILDNSASMSTSQTLETSDENGKVVKSRTVAAADPDRLAVIATLIFRSFLDPDDRLTILTFDFTNNEIGRYSVLPNTAAAIRHLGFDQPTPFTGPFQQAREILTKSPLPRKILLLVTDGVPDSTKDPLTPEQAKQLLGIGGPVDFEVLSLALTDDPDIRVMQSQFLGPLGRLEQIDSPTELVNGFTQAYADSIRSRPDTGTLAVGARVSFRAPKYVSEVMVALATVNRTGVFEAVLEGGGGTIAPLEGGDSGCTAPRTPCHAYQVFKAKKSPSVEEEWSLSLPRGAGSVAYGIILRYELGAEIVSMSEARVGEEKEVIARLTWQGQGFHDPAFFTADDFAAVLVLGDQESPLTLRPDDGSFAGKITVAQPGPQEMVARFSNKWLTVTAERPFEAEAWLPLTVVVKPSPIDFGKWIGARAESERCVELDFTGSVNVDQVPLEMVGQGLPAGFELDLPKAGSTISGNTARVCLVAPGCCAETGAPDKAALVIRGKDPHYHPEAVELPLAFSVAKTPFLTCWWRVIAGVIAAIALVIIANGFVSPHDFEREEVIRLASKEPGLARAAGRRLRELPGGRRGFYRHARVAFDGTGGAVKPGSGASLVLQATKNDTVVVSKTTIEQKDPRTRKWAAIDAGDGLLYLRRGAVYRVGEFYFRIG